jgi:predicted RNase H-like HicB family nuclease
MRRYDYTVSFARKADGNYEVVFPGIPQIRTFGSTLRDARDIAADALRRHLEGLIEYGAAVPTEPPTTSSDAQRVKEMISITL